MAAESISARAGRATLRVVRKGARLLRGQMVEMAGGPARAHVIMLFGFVLALSSADTATVGAIAPELEQAMKIGNGEIGLLSSAALLIGALFVIPVGLIVDRARRVPMLAASIVLWSVASLASAFADSFSMLLLTRLALGAVTATAGPAIASLTGDYFPAGERGRVYGYILGGEGLGAASGFVLIGPIAAVISWRAAFVLLAIPGVFLARSLWRTLPEPRRGGQSRLYPGASTFDAKPAAEQMRGDPATQTRMHDDSELAHAAIRQRGIKPNPRLVLREDTDKMGIRHAIRYILAIPTNVLLIVSSALGYFFFAGLETFVVVFVKGSYGVGQGGVTLFLVVLMVAYLAGTLISGWVTDAMLRRGFLESRIWVPAICYLGATALLIPGILGKSLTPALWFDAGGAALLSAANPPLDAARLDIMTAGLWGRAESVRTFLRSLAQALAPLLFGELAVLIAGIAPEQAPVGTHAGTISESSATGLKLSFLVMLVSLAAAGVVLLRARRTYPIDVATAAASQRGVEQDERAAGDSRQARYDPETEDTLVARRRRRPRW